MQTELMYTSSTTVERVLAYGYVHFCPRNQKIRLTVRCRLPVKWRDYSTAFLLMVWLIAHHDTVPH